MPGSTVGKITHTHTHTHRHTRARARRERERERESEKDRVVVVVVVANKTKMSTEKSTKRVNNKYGEVLVEGGIFIQMVLTSVLDKKKSYNCTHLNMSLCWYLI